MAINKEPDQLTIHFDFGTTVVGWSNLGRRNVHGESHVWPRGEIHVGLETVKLKRLFSRARCRWQDNIKVDIKEVGCEGVEWIQGAQYMAIGL